MSRPPPPCNGRTKPPGPPGRPALGPGPRPARLSWQHQDGGSAIGGARRPPQLTAPRWRRCGTGSSPPCRTCLRWAGRLAAGGRGARLGGGCLCRAAAERPPLYSPQGAVEGHRAAAVPGVFLQPARRPRPAGAARLPRPRRQPRGSGAGRAVRESRRLGSERGAFGSAPSRCAETGRVEWSEGTGAPRLGLPVREGGEEPPAVAPAARAPAEGSARGRGRVRGAAGLWRAAAAAVRKCAR